MKKLFLTFAALATICAAKAQLISTFAGNGTAGYTGDGGPATAAELKNPIGVTVDGSGNVYIVDSWNGLIRKVTTAGIISTVAGIGTIGYTGDGGPATSAKMHYPFAVAIDGSGNMYISDQYNQVIRKVNTSGIISTIAGNDTAGYSGDGGVATSAKLNYPGGVAVDGSGNVYFSDNNNNRIRKVNTSGIISTIAGNGTAGYSGDGSAATTAEFNSPTALAIDGSGNIFIADENNNRIRKINTSGIISTVAGNGTSGFTGDGSTATSAELSSPSGIAVDGTGNLFITDRNNYRIRKVNTSGTINTIAGTSLTGYSGDGGLATSGELNSPWGVAVDGSGKVFIADAGNQRIRLVSAVPLPIAGATSVCIGAAIALSDAIAGGVWSSSNTTIATVGLTSGSVFGVTAGTATISYTIGPSSSVLTVTVNPLPATISGTPAVCAGLTSALIDAGGGTWSSSNTSVATVGTGTGILTGIMAGSATITYTLPTTGCFITDPVTVNPLPTAYSVTGGGSYCMGGAGINVGLSGSNTGIHYQLYNGSSTIGAPITGSGLTLNFGLLTAAGIYTVMATNDTTTCINNMTGSATITINPLPAVYAVSGSGSFFDSTTIGLSVSQVGINYQLFKGSTTIGSSKPGTGSTLSFTVTLSGTYIIVATNSTTGCIDTMGGSAVIVISPSTTGVINQMSNNDIVIAPNPAHQTLFIKAPILHRVQVNDMTGRILIDESCNSKEISINVGNLNPGIYLVRINDQFIQKIIKE